MQTYKRVSCHSMKTLLLIISLFFLTNSLFAQTTVNFSNDSDTAFWYQYKNDNAKQLKLGLIENDTADYTFRFWSFGLVILIKSNNNVVSGEIVRFVESYPRKKKSKTFSKRYVISNSKVIEVRQLIDSLGIEQLPSAKNIQGWTSSCDGIEYLIEFKQNGMYSFKNYWTFTAQDSLSEAILFQNFVSSLYRILDLEKISTEFQKDIPFDSWKGPGCDICVYRVKQKNKKLNSR